MQDVKSLGKKGETVKVSDGYARNFILAKKLGVEATAANIATQNQYKRFEEKEAARILAEAKELAASFEGKTVVVTAKTGQGGRIYGAVSTKEIAQAAQAQLGVTLDKKKILLEEPIRTLGTQDIPVRLHKDVLGKLTVSVREAE